MKKTIVGAACILMLAGCSNNSSSSMNSSSASSSQSSSSAETGTNVQIGQAYYAAHGTGSVAIATVVMQDDRILAAYIDDLQFMEAGKDGVVALPNSDGEFQNNINEGMVLASKRESTSYYSALMKEVAGSTNPIEQNFASIQDYVKGKTIAEIQETAAMQDPEEVTDAVSGSTLSSTQGYLNAILEAASRAK